tara:strand:+ start:742 stop:1221 length:480 start_codon:yes stop_codon:yes gene_type:complete
MLPDVENTLRNLGVVAQMKQHDKLLTEGEHFAIYVPTAMRSLYRFFYSETREQNMRRVAECVRQAKYAVTRTLSDHSQSESECRTMSLQLLRCEESAVCFRVITALSECLDGLDNMTLTYRDDAALVVRIQQIKGDITDFLENTQVVAQTSSVIQRLVD